MTSKPPAIPKAIEVEDEVALTTVAVPEETKGKKASREFPEAFDGLAAPKSLWTSRHIGEKITALPNNKKLKGVLHVCGRGSKTAEVMFLSGSILREEGMTTYSSKPAMLNGPAGSLFLRALNKCGFKDSDWFYTALVKYNVPKLKPNAQDIRWSQEILDDEIKTIKPKLIVCLGKPAFDHLFKLKFKLKDVQGGFFRCDEYDCMLYPMDSILTPLMKPEYFERCLVDLREVRKALDEVRGHSVVKVQTSYHTLDTAEKLGNFCKERFDEIEAGKLHMASVDCEWQGQTAWGGQLRSYQVAWKPGHAAYVRLCAPVKGKQEYVMDQPLPVIREIISPMMNHPKLKFIGHNAHADMAWLDNHLDVKVWGRIAFDTMFAQQLLNEYADLKLERCAVQYTDMGRYDLPLMLWKKRNKFNEDDGYGAIPDDIIIPYGCMDVDSCLRMYPILMKQLIQQRLATYYFNYTLPGVTDGFYELMSTGLPIDRDYLSEMRDTYKHHGDMLLGEFRTAVKKEADTLLLTALRERAMALGCSSEQATNAFLDMLKLSKQGSKTEPELRALLQSFALDPQDFAELLPLYLHWRECPQFNISSTDHLRRWLFDVKKFTPLKTTKKDGIQMAWDKVLNLPPDKQCQYTPAADKQTIKVLATKDKLVAQIEELKSVQNITKIFLQGPDEEGNEQGLHKWVQPDDKIHSNFAIAETARNRAWHPNILNWPKAITKPIESAFARINIIVAADRRKELQCKGASDEAIAVAVQELMTKPTSVRSIAKVLDGELLADMDLKTAEVFALGYLSDDDNLIKVLTEPDVQFARIDKDKPKKAVRICYNDNVVLPESARDPKLITALDDPRLLRGARGELLHPMRDVHWEMAEETVGKPRELLDEDIERAGLGKVGNFSIPYGASGTLLERMIEANTGVRPPEGTGDKMIEAHARRYPKATEFQQSMERCIEDPGHYRAISGRVRHFFYNGLGDLEGLSDYSREGILSPIKRQARNFP